MMKEMKFSSHIKITVSTMIIVYSWFIGGEDIHISMISKLKLVTYK